MENLTEEDLYKLFNTPRNLKERSLSEKIWDIKYNVERVLNEVFVYPIRNFFVGIKAIIRYAPLIYRDRDWDQGFMFDLLSFKVGRMRKHAEECFIPHGKKSVKRLRVVELLCKRIGSSDYYVEKEMFPKLRVGINNMPVSMYQEEEDLKLLCKYLEKYSRTWWC